MCEVVEAILRERFKDFIPNQIFFVGWAVTQYNPILQRPFEEYAEKEYDEKTEETKRNLAYEKGKEADLKGLKKEAKGNYIKPFTDEFLKQRQEKKNNAVKARIEELKTEIP